jgi:hypothetical protein
VGISRDYPLKTRTSKQPIREIPGYEIIPSHPLKYPRSKQGLKEKNTKANTWHFNYLVDIAKCMFGCMNWSLELPIWNLEA